MNDDPGKVIITALLAALQKMTADQIAIRCELAALKNVLADAIGRNSNVSKEKIIEIINQQTAEYARGAMGGVADQSHKLASDMLSQIEAYLKGMSPPTDEADEESKG